MTERSVVPMDRSRPPTPGGVRPFEFPEVISIPFPSGLGLRIAPVARFPLVTMTVVLPSGESVVPDATAGLALLTGSALEGGTAKRGGPELAEAFEEIGSGFSVHTGWDSITLSVTSLADRKREALGLLSEVLREPAFPAAEVERVRSQRLAAIQQRRMDPGSLGDDSAAHLIFGDSVPYHRPLGGTRASVEGLGPTEVRGFWEDWFRPRGGGLVMVGDIEAAEVEGLATEFFGGWEGAPPEAAPFKVEPRNPRGGVVVVDRPGAVQSEIRIGQIGVARSSPHFFPLQVLNTVLGGAFTSRLMLNLREEKGFTYGIRSRFAFRNRPGPFVISTAVATEVTAAAVEEALSELRGLVRDGPTPEELTQSRDYLAGVFPLRLETTGQVAARIAELLVYDLPADFYSTYRDQIRGVTPEAVLEAGQACLRPDSLMVVIVGDGEKVRGPLEDLGLGPVELLTSA